MDQAKWAARIREQMAYEFQREGHPEGFPALPSPLRVTPCLAGHLEAAH